MEGLRIEASYYHLNSRTITRSVETCHLENMSFRLMRLNPKTTLSQVKAKNPLWPSHSGFFKSADQLRLERRQGLLLGRPHR